MSFTFKISQIAGNTHIQFSGNLDENAALPDNSATFNGDLVLNFGGVYLINSLGSRHWVLWIKSLKANGKIRFVECTPSVIGQANVLAGFLPKGALVESFYVPCFCASCNLAESALLDASEVQVSGGTVQVMKDIRCKKCGGKQTIEVSPQSYFNFLRK